HLSSPSASLFPLPPTPTTDIYPLSLHDALPISLQRSPPSFMPLDRPRPPAVLPRQRHSLFGALCRRRQRRRCRSNRRRHSPGPRSEEHTSELQSRVDLVCRLLLEKKNKQHHVLSDQHEKRQKVGSDAEPQASRTALECEDLAVSRSRSPE